MAPVLQFTTVNIGAPDPLALARFYEHLLGFAIARVEPHDVLMRDPNGGVGLSSSTSRTTSDRSGRRPDRRTRR